MKVPALQTRWIAGGLLAATVLVATAPLAEAGHGHGRRVRGYSSCEPQVIRYRGDWGGPRRVYVRRSSSGPALAGFFGGLVLGAALADRADARVVYWDPYCHTDFASLEVYASHCSYHHHPRTWRVYERDRGGDWDGDRYGRRDDRGGWEDGDSQEDGD